MVYSVFQRRNLVCVYIFFRSFNNGLVHTNVSYSFGVVVKRTGLRSVQKTFSFLSESKCRLEGTSSAILSDSVTTVVEDENSSPDKVYEKNKKNCVVLVLCT